MQIQKTKKILSSKCAVCDIKNMRLVKEQDADALLIIISKIPLMVRYTIIVDKKSSNPNVYYDYGYPKKNKLHYKNK